MEKHICNPNCIFYPTSPSSILKFYTDEYGLKHREAVYICGYDDTRIIKYEECPNFVQSEKIQIE